jgi:pyridoxine 5-phosphate synthase
LEFFSRKIIEAGAHGITVHPRPDQRHIRADDLSDLAEITKELEVEFNVEGNPYEDRLGEYPGFLNLIESVKPSQCTLVPDDSNQLTSDHGWNIHFEHNKLVEVLDYLKINKIRSSIFLDPDKSQLDAAKEIGVDRVEIYTGPFAEAFKKNDETILNTYKDAIEYANDIGLEVNAGHDLNLENLPTLLSYGLIKEVSIGHALITESLIYGIENTVQKYIKITS